MKWSALVVVLSLTAWADKAPPREEPPLPSEVEVAAPQNTTRWPWLGLSLSFAALVSAGWVLRRRAQPAKPPAA